MAKRFETFCFDALRYTKLVFRIFMASRKDSVFEEQKILQKAVGTDKGHR